MPNNHSTLTSLFKDIADVIRVKIKSTESIKADFFPSYIRDIVTNPGGGNAGNYVALTGMIEGTMPGAYTNYSANRVSSYALQNCRLLEEINLTEASYVGEYAFRGCVALKRATFSKCLTIMSFAFQNLSSALEEVIFDRCTTIHQSAFHNCINLHTISFPELKYINDGAFSQCKNLKIASFPMCISIGPNAFHTCIRLTNVSAPTCTHIDVYAFMSCSALSTAFFPAVSVIREGAFMNCIELSRISFPNVVNFGKPQQSKYYPNSYSQFAGCIRLEDVYMPNYEGTYSTGAYMFRDCTRLSQISLPKIVYLPDYFFSGCYNLETAYLPNAIKISGSVFYNCSKLKNITLSPSLSQVLVNAFCNCITLPSLVFEGNPQFQTYSTFTNCSRLSRIEIRGSSLAIASGGHNVIQYMFNGTPMTDITLLGQFGSIYVRASLLSVYQKASGWSLISSRFAALT